jgi:hypothetical protein
MHAADLPGDAFGAHRATALSTRTAQLCCARRLLERARVATVLSTQAKQAGLRPRLGAAAAAESGSPFPANVRSLFSYKRYSEQEPLDISAAEAAAAVALVLGPDAATGLLGPELAPLLVPDPTALSAGLVAGAHAVQVRLWHPAVACMCPCASCTGTPALRLLEALARCDVVQLSASGVSPAAQGRGHHIAGLFASCVAHV